MGGVQSVAGSDGLDRRAGAAAVRRPGLSRRPRRRGGRHRGGGDRSRVRRRARGRGAAVAEADRPESVGRMMLDRRTAIAALLAHRDPDLAIVTGLGSTTYDVASVGDDDRNFYLWGAMGGAALVGLGLALARPDLRTAVITGDGELLMGLGGLATVGVQRPANLAIIVFDNGVYGETGMQASHTHGGVDLTAAATACGIEL